MVGRGWNARSQSTSRKWMFCHLANPMGHYQLEHQGKEGLLLAVPPQHNDWPIKRCFSLFSKGPAQDLTHVAKECPKIGDASWYVRTLLALAGVAFANVGKAETLHALDAWKCGSWGTVIIRDKLSHVSWQELGLVQGLRHAGPYVLR